ncbi:sentrin-specific protease 6 isoform X3 [Amia ocellicauda]|uniref:sentrin-specific protease 6 isoform X3 n=1 Tax=Amia ocellicauda TaxID=2972642 RepID=UPI003464301F
MAHKRSLFIQALDRSEAKKDGGFKQNWSFSISDDNEEERDHDTAPLVRMDESDGLSSPEGKKPPSLKHFCSGEPLKTYERRPNNHLRSLKGNTIGLNMLGAGKKLSENSQAITAPSINSRTNYFIVGPSVSQGVVVQGRIFQHANAQAVVKTAAQRKEYPAQIQRVELDSIILTCPEPTDTDSLALGEEIKRRTQQKRRSSSEDMGSLFSSPENVEALEPNDYLTLCGKCDKPSEDHVTCENCGHLLSQDSPSNFKNSTNLTETASSLSRPAIHPHSSGPNSLQLSKNFYSSALTMKAPQVDKAMTTPIRITRGNPLLPNGRTGIATGSSPSVLKISKGKRQLEAKQHELNDPIVLSSDDEEEEADTASTGSVNRVDSVSPRPADPAHSSPAPSGGKVEAAVKENMEQSEWVTSDYFTDIDTRILIPRKARMKDQFGNVVPDKGKRRKLAPTNVATPCAKLPSRLDSFILDCRSIRLGTLRRMVIKPVIFTVEYIKIETEAATEESVQEILLKTSELVCCEWCSVRKLPVIFFQTTSSECLRLQRQLQMSKENGGVWYDCNATNIGEKYIVLIFENGLSLPDQVYLEGILHEIGKANNINDFLVKISFDEANVRLVRFTKTFGETVSKQKVSDSSLPMRMSTRLQASTQRKYEDDEEMAEFPLTFTGPIEKLIVYPPAPAKGGISVTNEDLHCLNEGEFLNDVIIDFYLKYLVLEKLKKEDAHRSHIFSSFFYKRLNQRERRSVPDSTNLPIQKRKHNRVKTWTRHVDLFQKDFIFVPINESAHWFLAVICFPGLEAAQLVPNPLYQPPDSRGSLNSSLVEESLSSSNEETEKRTESLASAPSPRVSRNTPSKVNVLGTSDPTSESESSTDHAKGVTVSSDGTEEDVRAGRPEGRTVDSRSSASVNGFQAQRKKAPQHFTDGLHRISVCYGGVDKNTADDTYTFSDQDSSQDESSEDGTDDMPNSADSAQWNTRPTICKQPCILIMDSLRGPTRSTVVKTLREYLEVEWEVRKGNKRSFAKDVMKGSSPRVPQQDNFSDCGVYVLQYVESFFENPLPSFHLPMDLTNWFPPQRMKKKREEIKELILKIQSRQQDKRGHRDSQTEALGESLLEKPTASC